MEESAPALPRKPTGAFIWAKMTEENTGKCIAMVSNHIVLSAPRVNEPVTGGNCTITTGLSQELFPLYLTMEYGRLRAPVTIQTLAFSPTGIYTYPWLKYLVIGLVSFIIFFFLVLFIDRIIQNAFKSSHSLASGE